MNPFRIVYEDRRDAEFVLGMAMPLFIKNGDFYLTTLDIYEDGAADCWELIPLSGIEAKVRSGWLDMQPPEHARLMLRGLGMARAVDAEWWMPTGGIVKQAEALFHQLNPKRRNLVDLPARRQQIANRENRRVETVGQRRMRYKYGTVYRLGADKQMIRGSEMLIFHIQANEYLLTRCFVYADRQAQLGVEGDLFPVEAILPMLESGQLRTFAPDGTKVVLPDFGRFTVYEGQNWLVDAHEYWLEIGDQLAELNDDMNSIAACQQVFSDYQAQPTAENRERLRIAYQKVPKLKRSFSEHDSDYWDHKIWQICGGK